ncbi:MAG: hypothetical protein GY856_05170, partial [bacterium]|nr:hypothetical protein [bacterium]
MHLSATFFPDALSPGQEQGLAIKLREHRLRLASVTEEETVIVDESWIWAGALSLAGVIIVGYLAGFRRRNRRDA